MNIQTITKMLIDAGIEEREAKKEVKMLLEHFCNYSEKDEKRIEDKLINRWRLDGWAEGWMDGKMARRWMDEWKNIKYFFYKSNNNGL